MLESFKLAFNEAFPQWLYDIIMSGTFEAVLWIFALLYFIVGIFIFGEIYEYITKRMVVVSTSVWAFAFLLWGMKGYFVTDSLWSIPAAVIVPTGFFHLILGCCAYTYHDSFVARKT